MNANPLFSVIIPHKNTPDLLQRCLDSIPRRDDVQIIVVDDNSDPKLVDFEKFPGLNDNNIEVYFTKEGKGAGYARNVGMSHAKGEWLIFADADDYYYTDNLSKLMDMDIPNEYDVVVWKSEYVYLDGTSFVIGEDANDQENENIIRKNTTDKLYLNYVTPWAKMVRRKLCNDKSIIFEEVKYANDEIFSTLIGVYVNKYLYIDLLLYRHEMRVGSLVEQKSLENYLCRLYVCFRKNEILKRYGKYFYFNFLYIQIYSIKYISFLKAFFNELCMLGWNRTCHDYVDVCKRLDISYIPFLRKISIRRFKHHLSSFSQKNIYNISKKK